MTPQLRFDLATALRLAEHAASTPENSPSLTELHDSRDCPGALEWVAEGGATYLMSGGHPPLLANPEDPTSNVIAYAEQGGPTPTASPAP